MEYNFCFVCLSPAKQVKVEVKTERFRKKVKLESQGTVCSKKSENSLKYLIHYLLHTKSLSTYEGLLANILKFHRRGDIAVADEILSESSENCSKLQSSLKLCEKCELVADRILD